MGNTFIAEVRGKTLSGTLKSLSCLRKRSDSSSITWTSRPWDSMACKLLVVCALDTHPPKSSRVFRQNFSAFWDYFGGNTVSISLADSGVKKYLLSSLTIRYFSCVSEETSCCLTFLGTTCVLKGSLQQQPCHVEQAQYFVH